MNFKKFFRHRGTDHKTALGITEAVPFSDLKPVPDMSLPGIATVQEAIRADAQRIADATTLPTDVSKALVQGVEANLAEQSGPVVIVERYADIYDQSLATLKAKRTDVAQAMEERQFSHDRFMDYKREELRQIDVSIAAAESARRVLRDEPSDEEIARANERAREIVRTSAHNRRKPAAKASTSPVENQS